MAHLSDDDGDGRRRSPLGRALLMATATAVPSSDRLSQIALAKRQMDIVQTT